MDIVMVLIIWIKINDDHKTCVVKRICESTQMIGCHARVMQSEIPRSCQLRMGTYSEILEEHSRATYINLKAYILN